MEYTKNYHLPQWVKEDRVLMDDFNAAMAGIESGLTEGRTERAALMEKIQLAEAGTSASAQAALHNGLFRLAYNRWWYLASLDEMPRQVGFFRQGFAQGEGGAAGGMLQLTDRMWTANGGAALTADLVVSTVRQLSTISYSSGSDTCSFTFTPPYSGRLTAFNLSGSYQGNTDKHNTGACTVRLYDDEAGTLLLETPGSLRFSGTSGAGATRMPLDYIIHGKTRYRIETQIDLLDIQCTYRVDTSSTAIVKCVEVTGRNQETATITRQFQLDEASQGGMILVHYDTWGAGGSLSLGWQGETLAPHKTRTVTDSLGRTVQEAEFRLSKAVPASSTATLTIHCESGGEFSLYDWGGMLI